MKGIKDVYYRHATRVFKSFNNKKLTEYHNLYIESDTLLLADEFGYFRTKCVELDELDTAHCLSPPGLSW